MLIHITVNQNGFVGMWLTKPERYNNKWKAKFPYIDSVSYKNVKKFVEETQMNWTSDPVSIPLNL